MSFRKSGLTRREFCQRHHYDDDAGLLAARAVSTARAVRSSAGRDRRRALPSAWPMAGGLKAAGDSPKPELAA